MNLQVNHIITDTKVEGPGNRTCIFVQGCLQHCSGCNSPQTWDLTGGDSYDINELADKILSNNNIEGVTFSGGEPLLQSKALYQLALILKQEKLSIVTFTGYDYDFIREINEANWNNLLNVTDLLISGSYNENEKSYDKIWVGSLNQEHHFLTGRYRYLENKLDTLENKIEVRLEKDGTLLVKGMGDNKKIRKMFENLL